MIYIIIQIWFIQNSFTQFCLHKARPTCVLKTKQANYFFGGDGAVQVSSLHIIRNLDRVPNARNAHQAVFGSCLSFLCMEKGNWKLRHVPQNHFEVSFWACSSCKLPSTKSAVQTAKRVCSLTGKVKPGFLAKS